jgi:hypothetical protein
MRARRNQSTAPATKAEAACPSCFYDEVFATAQALAAGGSTTVSLEIEFAQYMCPQFADVVVMSAANSQINERAVLTDLRVGACSQFGSDGTAATTSAGLIVPDQLSASSECCLGTPVCWGAFGKTALNQALLFFFTSLSAATVEDIYITVRGQAMDKVPLGWKIGKRCTQCAA